MERANKPLTLGQLKQMNGQPVWWWNKSQKPTVTICLFDRFSKEPHFVSYDFVVEDSTKISKYSLIRRWGYLPYASDPTAQQPAHIDREKWGGSWEGEADGYADGELVYDTWKCSGCGHTEETDDPNWLPDFCPDCGRAMTDKAWAELERRVFGG